MPYHVILVEPKYGGNIGATARAMANFGFGSLILVNPAATYDKENETWERAVHARSIVDDARVVRDVDEALALVDYAVATTSELSTNARKHRRDFVPLDETAERLAEVEGEVGILFGREDYGLYNEEVGRCHLVTTIPTSPEYRSMNLSHAVGVVLYELAKPRISRGRPRRADAQEAATFLRYFDAVLDAIDLKDYRRPQTSMAMRRLLGRAAPSKWEYHRLMGVLSGVLKTLKRPLPGGAPEPLEEAEGPEEEIPAADRSP